MCDWIEISKGFLTPVVAAIAAYIAWQQWATNHNKLRLDLFDRRFELYANVYNVLHFTITRGSVSEEQLVSFQQTLHKSHFLLDESMSSFLLEVDAKYGDLCVLGKELKSLSEEEERTKNIEAQRHIKEWMERQKSNLKCKFEKYLKVDA